MANSRRHHNPFVTHDETDSLEQVSLVPAGIWFLRDELIDWLRSEATRVAPELEWRNRLLPETVAATVQPGLNPNHISRRDQ